MPDPESLKFVTEAISEKMYRYFLFYAQRLLRCGAEDAEFEVRGALHHAARGVEAGKFDRTRDFNKWAFPVIKYYLLDRYRRQKAQPSHDGAAEVEDQPGAEVSAEDLLLLKEEKELHAKAAENLKPEKLRLVYKRIIELIDMGHKNFCQIIEQEFHESYGINANYAKALYMRGRRQIAECVRRFPHAPQQLWFIITMRYAARGKLREHPQKLCEEIADEAQQRIASVPRLRDVICEFLSPKRPAKIGWLEIRSVLIKIDKLLSGDMSRARTELESIEP